LFKEYKKATQGKTRTKHDEVFTYLTEVPELKKKRCPASKYEHFLNLEVVEEALKVNVGYQLDHLSGLMRSDKNKLSKKDFTNLRYGVDIVAMSTAHIRYVTFFNFKAKLATIKCKNARTLMTNLCTLYGLNQLHLDSKACFESGYFQPGTPYSELILEAIKQINTDLRPQIVSLVECLEMPDTYLQSAIGNSYGDIYETHLKWARESRLNQTKLGDAIPDGYMEYMMPILKAKM